LTGCEFPGQVEKNILNSPIQHLPHTGTSVLHRPVHFGTAESPLESVLASFHPILTTQNGDKSTAQAHQQLNRSRCGMDRTGLTDRSQQPEHEKQNLEGTASLRHAAWIHDYSPIFSEQRIKNCTPRQSTPQSTLLHGS
jgi:hypothetical protein